MAVGGGRAAIPAQQGIALIELPDLAFRAPARKAAARLPEMGAAAGRIAAGEMEARRKLMGDPLVLDEALVAGRLNGLLVEAHGLAVMPFEAGDLGRHQRVLVRRRSAGNLWPIPAAVRHAPPDRSRHALCSPGGTVS